MEGIQHSCGFFLISVLDRLEKLPVHSTAVGGFLPAPRSAERPVLDAALVPAWCPHPGVPTSVAQPNHWGLAPSLSPSFSQSGDLAIGWKGKASSFHPPWCSVPNSLSLSNFWDARNYFPVSAPPCGLLGLPVGLALPDSQEHLRTDGHTDPSLGMGCAAGEQGGTGALWTWAGQEGQRHRCCAWVVKEGLIACSRERGKLVGNPKGAKANAVGRKQLLLFC